MTELCSVTDETGQCPKPVHARGWCNSHWARWKRNGTPGPVKLRRIRRGDDAVCSVDGCGRIHAAHGYCATHRRRETTGEDLNLPIQQQASKVRLTDHEMGLIADTSIPTRDVAEQIGLSQVTISRRRQEMGIGVLRVSDWTDYEIDFLIENIGKMKNERMAGYLNRSVGSVHTEIGRLRANGVVAKRTTARLDPWIISGRPLIAKTCPDCGLFLSAEWFPKQFSKGGKRHNYWPNCKKCRVDRKRTASDSSKEKWAVVKREYEAKLQAYTLERAENHGKEWTTPDLEVLADASKTTLEKALELKRTYAATNTAVSRNGFASKTVHLKDPHDSAWKLFWEFEDLAVAS